MDTTIKNSNLKSEEYFINMGPQHPATHGVLRLLLTIDGEIIKKVEPDLGYIHRSIEKMCERDSYQQIVHLTDRMDYLSSHINNEAVCLTVENALQLEMMVKTADEGMGVPTMESNAEGLILTRQVMNIFRGQRRGARGAIALRRKAFPRDRSHGAHCYARRRRESGYC